jgi:hypothetical protein
MKWLDRRLKYIGQTGRIFRKRYREHVEVRTNNNFKSGYPKLTINTGYTYVIIIDVMDIIKTGRKGKYLKTSEAYYIY